MKKKELRKNRTLRMTDAQYRLLKKTFGGLGKAIDFLCNNITPKGAKNE